MLAMLAGDDSIDHATLLSIMVSLFGLAIGSPILMMLIQSRQIRTNRAEDQSHRKQTTAALLASNHEVAVKAEDVATRTDRHLTLIHSLVNSNLTKAMENERNAIEQALGAITEVIDMKLAMGQDVLPESYAAQAKLDEQLEALNETIHERHKTLRFLQNGSPNNDDGTVA